MDSELRFFLQTTFQEKMSSKLIHPNYSRRQFLIRTTQAAALAGIPLWYAEQHNLFAQAAPSKSPNEKPSLGLIGCGGMGTNDAKIASKYANIVALCDVDSTHIDAAKKNWPEAKTYNDFRKIVEQKDLDGVICGTVDHWHVLVS